MNNKDKIGTGFFLSDGAGAHLNLVVELDFLAIDPLLSLVWKVDLTGLLHHSARPHCSRQEPHRATHKTRKNIEGPIEQH